MNTRALRIAGWTLGGVLVLLVLLAAFPWQWLHGTIEAKASERFGRPVTIGAMTREDGFGFHPQVALRDVRVPQAAWAGSGDLARVRAVSLGFSVWALLLGRFRPDDGAIDGARLALVRAADGRTNWQRDGGDGEGGGPNLSGLTIRDSVVSYRDAKEDRQATLRLAADPRTGLRVEGSGTVQGAPVRIAARGPALDRGKPWPFEVRLDGALLAMRATGTMDRPLDTGAMTLDVTGRADDLKRIDTVIEAGLFHTQPVRLRAHIRHDADRWTVTGLAGTIGRSDLSGRLTVDKADGRTKIDGALDSRRFAFDDLSSDAGRAAGRALEARIGPRLVPNTPIDIGKIDADGRLAFRVRSIIGEDSDTVINMRGVMVMDHHLLTVEPLRMRIAQGVVTGRAVIDQRGGRRTPILTLDLSLADGRVATFAGGGEITGRIAARARLKGPGETIRDAVGHASGSLGFVARDGSLPAKYAAALGFDAGRALLANDGERSRLRCLVARLAMRDGTGRGDPAVIDTAISQLTGSGTVSFPDERLAFTLRGAPKRDVLLRIPGSVTIAGTLQQPRLVVPDDVKSVGNIFRAIGNRITGHSGPVATDADCAALAARALR